MNQAQQDSHALISAYYQQFNDGNLEGFLALLQDDVVHDINQGGRETGVAVFRAFMDKMNRSYREQLVDIEIMVNADGSRAAAEFVVLGEYLATDEGLPEANGQTYRHRLPAGAFFEIRDGKVARISNYYNLQDWLDQVGA
ncbi:MAG: ketosteroid isomerase-related protein [Thiolinea sp.]